MYLPWPGFKAEMFYIWNGMVIDELNMALDLIYVDPAKCTEVRC